MTPQPPSRSKPPKVLAFGDSHSHALQRAVAKRKGKGQPVPLTVYRLLKEKNGGHIGDTAFEEFLAKIAKLGPEDVVVSMIGGNQHAVLSTIQHPRPFDFFLQSGPAPDLSAGVEMIPYRAIADLFQQGFKKGDGQSLEAIRSATVAHVVHVAPPPPKADNAFIEEYHESLFATKGLARRGVSPPELRLKFWTLQTQILRRLCRTLGIELIMPPRAAVSDGYLRPEYYAQDATHANWRYGERVIREIERRYLAPGGTK
jgi:hypothetical protein